jgi:hypothetical protein
VAGVPGGWRTLADRVSAGSAGESWTSAAQSVRTDSSKAKQKKIGFMLGFHFIATLLLITLM